MSIFLQELASLDLPHRYSMAFIPSGSIGLVTDEGDLRTVFSRIRAHMEPGATLLLELESDDDQTGSSAEPEPRTVTCADGSSITYTCIASRTGDTVCFSGNIRQATWEPHRRDGDRGVSAAAVQLAEPRGTARGLPDSFRRSHQARPMPLKTAARLVEASVQALLGPLRGRRAVAVRPKAASAESNVQSGSRSADRADVDF